MRKRPEPEAINPNNTPATWAEVEPAFQAVNAARKASAAAQDERDKATDAANAAAEAFWQAEKNYQLALRRYLIGVGDVKVTV